MTLENLKGVSGASRLWHGTSVAQQVVMVNRLGVHWLGAQPQTRLDKDSK